MSSHKKKITAKEFDAKFDAGERVTEQLDLSKATRPGHVKNRVNVDIPVWMIRKLDRLEPNASLADHAAGCHWR